MRYGFGLSRDARLEECDFSVRVHHCLTRAGVLTVGDLEQLSLRDLSTIRNLGPRSVAEVFSWMAEHVQLTPDNPVPRPVRQPEVLELLLIRFPTTEEDE